MEFLDYLLTNDNTTAITALLKDFARHGLFVQVRGTIDIEQDVGIKERFTSVHASLPG